MSYRKQHQQVPTSKAGDIDMHYAALYSHPAYSGSGKIVLFCNVTSYDHHEKKYLFDRILEDKKLLRILQPEHGLFSSAQDQDSVEDLNYKGIPCISLYNKSTGTTGPQIQMFSDADALLIDIQDAGVRYFTYTTHMFNLLEFVGKNFPELPVIVTDKPNPAGNKVEGTFLSEKYQSFLGYSGMIHRHGLNTGALCKWFLQTRNIMVNLHLVKIPCSYSNESYIAPSPNLPVIENLRIYPGQCFWEATTFSEGRGTSRPFILFGHPELSFKDAEKISVDFNSRFYGLAYLRPITFIPVFHKHANKLCAGWQIHMEKPQKYSCIMGTLWLMRKVKKIADIPFWREGPYEFDSLCTAAQLLLGDDDLIGFVDGVITESFIMEKFEFCALQWKKETLKL